MESKQIRRWKTHDCNSGTDKRLRRCLRSLDIPGPLFITGTEAV